MGQPAIRSTPRLYPGPTVHAFLQVDPARLEHLRSASTLHKTLCEGLVTRIEHRPGDQPLLHVAFPTTTRPRRFRLDALTQDRLTAAEVPPSPSPSTPSSSPPRAPTSTSSSPPSTSKTATPSAPTTTAPASPSCPPDL